MNILTKLFGFSIIAAAATGCMESGNNVRDHGHNTSDEEDATDAGIPEEEPVDDIEFSESETLISGGLSCDTTKLVDGAMPDGDDCKPGDVVLEKDVFVLKRDPTNHVSSGGKEFDLNASESRCSGNPPLCGRSTHHGYARTFNVKVTCGKDAMMNPTALFSTTMGVEDTYPKVESGHYHGLYGYTCAKGVGAFGVGVSAACKTLGLSQVSPQQTVMGAPAGNVSQDLYVAFAATHCPRPLFTELPKPDDCQAPELAAEVKGFGINFTAKNHTYSGKKKVSCTASCGAATPTLECAVVEDGNL